VHCSTMEEYNEYGNCGQDLMRRVHAENRTADAVVKGWEEEDEKPIDTKKRSAIEEKDSGSKNDRSAGVKGKRKGIKEPTGAEMHKMISERNDMRSVKKAKMEARKMVRKGKMRSLNSYFKNNNSDCE
jgi:hypothetical protein